MSNRRLIDAALAALAHLEAERHAIIDRACLFDHDMQSTGLGLSPESARDVAVLDGLIDGLYTGLDLAGPSSVFRRWLGVMRLRRRRALPPITLRDLTGISL